MLFEREGSFAQTSFVLQRNDNWTDTYHSIIWVFIWVVILAGNRAQSELARLYENERGKV